MKGVFGIVAIVKDYVKSLVVTSKKRKRSASLASVFPEPLSRSETQVSIKPYASLQLHDHQYAPGGSLPPLRLADRDSFDNPSSLSPFDASQLDIDEEGEKVSYCTAPLDHMHAELFLLLKRIAVCVSVWV